MLSYKCHGYKLKSLFTHISILYLHTEGAFRLRFSTAFYQCLVMKGIVGKEERKLTFYCKDKLIFASCLPISHKKNSNPLKGFMFSHKMFRSELKCSQIRWRLSWNLVFVNHKNNKFLTNHLFTKCQTKNKNGRSTCR